MSIILFVLVCMQEEGGKVLALDLQEQIEGTLDELAARCILELLALPLDKEYEPQRQQGLQGLRSLLWTVDEDGNSPLLGGLTREELMKEAFTLMTATEQVRHLHPKRLSILHTVCCNKEMTLLCPTRLFNKGKTQYQF